MTRHEADRVHEASGIAFTFAGHLVWGNPKLAEGLHGDVETWRCGHCLALVVGGEAVTGVHAERHAQVDERLDVLSALVSACTEKLDRVDAKLRVEVKALADVAENVDTMRSTVDRISHGAFKPIEAVPGAVLSDQPKTERERRNPPATAHEMGADVERLTRVARWREAATVREVPPHSAARETAEQLRADGLPE